MICLTFIAWVMSTEQLPSWYQLTTWKESLATPRSAGDVHNEFAAMQPFWPTAFHPRFPILQPHICQQWLFRGIGTTRHCSWSVPLCWQSWDIFQALVQRLDFKIGSGCRGPGMELVPLARPPRANPIPFQAFSEGATRAAFTFTPGIFALAEVGTHEPSCILCVLGGGFLFVLLYSSADWLKSSTFPSSGNVKWLSLVAGRPWNPNWGQWNGWDCPGER